MSPTQAGHPSVPFLDLAAGVAATRTEVQAAIDRVLTRGWFVLGPEVDAFEQAFAAYVGARHGVGVASGTDALHLALRACGIGPGDEVITVPNTAVATVAAIEMAGARPVFADIDPITMNMAPASAAAAITPHTKALLPVHLYGQTADLHPLLELARDHGLRLIEDACQAHGALHRGRPVGGIGDIGCFSFYPTKNLGGYGDGGMAVTSDPHLAERLRLLRAYGWAERDRSVIRGVNSRLDELQAAILRVKLTHLDTWTTVRRALASRYQNALATAGWLTLPGDISYGRHVYHLFVVRTTQRDAFRQHLAERGIGTLVHYPTPIYLQDAYRDLGVTQGACPIAEQAAAQIVSLPLHPHLSEAEVDLVTEAVLAFTPA
ncbi:MAG: DegT/DnrJ/EryC1/StrS family aminotransferase [Dehalococcoidia bacterium]|nr:DegT/DnrJ/EryC1/StrS family aminotransferase [Dehalococcoidia bacterium]